MKCERYIQEEEADIVECSPRKKRSGGSKNKFSNSIFTFLSLKRWWVGGVDIKCFFFYYFFFYSVVFFFFANQWARIVVEQKKHMQRERGKRKLIASVSPDFAA